MHGERIKTVTDVYVFVNWIIRTSLNVSPWITENDTVKNLNHTSLNENYVVPCICLRAI